MIGLEVFLCIQILANDGGQEISKETKVLKMAGELKFYKTAPI